MKFFNIDLHVSVIEDMKYIFRDLGHEIVDWSISGHTKFFNKFPIHNGVVGPGNWRDIDQAMCDRFYFKYKDMLAQYDGFICTYPPAFSMLYEKFNKPIIINIPIRYEAPFWDNRDGWLYFNDFLQRNIDSGMVIPVANNKFDQAYFEMFVGRKCEWISSLCQYFPIKYRVDDTRRVLLNSFSDCPFRAFLPFFRGEFNWKDYDRFKAMVHVPYNVSVMKIFEHYIANIPMMFPSKKFLLDMIFNWEHKKSAMSQMSFNQIFCLPSKSCLFDSTLQHDPNNYNSRESFENWIGYADFYDAENMPHIQFFDSERELQDMCGSLDLQKISDQMYHQNALREVVVYGKWEKILKTIKGN